VELGNAYYETGRLQAAEIQYQYALQLDPELGVAMANLGSLYLTAGELDVAEYWLTRALTTTPLHAHGYVWLAVLRMHQGRLAEAALLLQQGRELTVSSGDPLHKIINRNLALIADAVR
jgi:Flp pilus assembly protein TadD